MQEELAIWSEEIFSKIFEVILQPLSSYFLAYCTSCRKIMGLFFALVEKYNNVAEHSQRISISVS